MRVMQEISTVKRFAAADRAESLKGLINFLRASMSTAR